jgi:CHAT domain-containing protein
MLKSSLLATLIILSTSIARAADRKSVPSSPNSTQQKSSPLQSFASKINQEGASALAVGNAELALKKWQEADKIYTQIGDRDGAIGTRINQAQALQSLGYYRQSLNTLQSVNTYLDKQPDSALKLRGLIGLANSLRALRVIEKSQKYPVGAKDILDRAATLANKLGDRGAIDRVNLSLGNTLQLLGTEEIERATEYYQLATKASDPLIKLQAKVNLYKLQSEQRIAPNTLAFLNSIQTDLQAAPASRGKVYAYINIVETIRKNQGDDLKQAESIVPLAKLLAAAIAEARKIDDRRSESQALSSLASLYELTGQYRDAKNVIHQALKISENINAPEISYKLNWQLGRVTKAANPNDLKPAIAAYRQSIERLKTLRNDLNAIDTDLQFSFRDGVEPVYRELVELLLTKGEKSLTENLAAARDTIESLQVAEIANYLRQGCLDTFTVQLDNIDRSATIIYPIVLSDRIATITSIPGKQLKYTSRPIASAEVDNLVGQLRTKMENGKMSDRDEAAFKGQARQLHDLILAPIASDLQQSKTTTLAFVLDGTLRNLPMAVLHDGKGYLVEKYSIALTPGLQLFPGGTLGERRQALLGGVSEGRQQADRRYEPLPGVKAEIEQISTLIPSQKLLNAEFTNDRFRSRATATDSPILHLATHGVFSSKPEDTYIMTWDGRIDLNEFGNLVRQRGGRAGNSIDLLVLSACQTATGDNRATLGIAGMAVRSGARSTIASLWSVDDESTKSLMTNLYQNLTAKNTTKARSLQLAQQTLLRDPKYRSPYYWAAFVLVGNWQ